MISASCIEPIIDVSTADIETHSTSIGDMSCDECVGWTFDGSLLVRVDHWMNRLPDPRDRWPLRHGSWAIVACCRCLGWTFEAHPTQLRYDDVLDALTNARAVHEDDEGSSTRWLQGCTADLNERPL